tara:strand:+ start:3397 stop:3564 length:168 start_codon:yes stop_codon:yes gene_type:complete
MDKYIENDAECWSTWLKKKYNRPEISEGIIKEVDKEFLEEEAERKILIHKFFKSA